MKTPRAFLPLAFALVASLLAGCHTPGGANTPAGFQTSHDGLRLMASVTINHYARTAMLSLLLENRGAQPFLVRCAGTPYQEADLRVTLDDATGKPVPMTGRGQVRWPRPEAAANRIERLALETQSKTRTRGPVFITEVPAGEFYATRVPLAEFFTLQAGRYRLKLNLAVDRGSGAFQEWLTLTDVAFEIRDR